MDNTNYSLGDVDILSANRHRSKGMKARLRYNDMDANVDPVRTCTTSLNLPPFQRMSSSDNVELEILRENAVKSLRKARAQPYPKRVIKDVKQRRGRAYMQGLGAQLPFATELLRPLLGRRESTYRASLVQRIYEDQLKNFKSILSLESDILYKYPLQNSHSLSHLMPLSLSTQIAADTISDSAGIKTIYQAHVQHWLSMNPLTTLVNGFCVTDRSHAHQMQRRYLDRRVNRVFAECDQMYQVELSQVLSIGDEDHGGIDEKLEQEGKQIYRQMKQYMDFLAGSRLPVKSINPRSASVSDPQRALLTNITTERGSNLLSARYFQKNGLGVSTHRFANTNAKFESNANTGDSATYSKEEGELTDNGETVRKTHRTQLGSPTPSEIEETFLPQIHPKKPESDEKETDSIKKKKKKRKKTKSSSDKKVHKKKKKDKKKDKSEHELPKAYAINTNTGDAPPRPFYRDNFRPFFRRNNYNNFNNRGFHNFRYIQNMRFRNRQNWQQMNRNVNNRFNRQTTPASRRYNNNKFVSESSSSDDEKQSHRTKSRSPRKASINDAAPSQSPEHALRETSAPPNNDSHQTRIIEKPKENSEPDDDASQNCALNLLSEYI